MGSNRRLKMVGWYNPIQLVKTGFEVLVSAIFGKHADRRIIDALSVSENAEGNYYDFSKSREGGMWIDYVADVGDGWNSTATVAHSLTCSELRLTNGKAGKSHDTKQGDVLIFGGDEVYPSASRENYRRRLIEPYNSAFPRTEESDKCVFAIPGNHDWYDSLASFSEIFYRDHDPDRKKYFGGWQTKQNRSYFALKLPNGWWLFGLDVQLGSALDKPQVEYFSQIVRNEFEDNDRIILCTPEPYWIYSKHYGDTDPAYRFKGMGYFTGYVLQGRVAAYIAGDTHYYKRHENSDSKKQRIVAGGGSAFLHPTHNEEKTDQVGIRSVYDLKTTFPEKDVSKNLTYLNLLFPILNPGFGLITGVLYLLTAQAFFSDIKHYAASDLGNALASVFGDFVTKPVPFYWVSFTIIGFILFGDAHSKIYRYIAGPIHALLHLAGVFVVSWVSAYLFSKVLSGYLGISVLDEAWRDSVEFLMTGALIFVGGWILSSFIMGVYLLVSLNIFKTHRNEAFSSLKISNYKNFLRFKIDKSGDLTIYPVGIRKVYKKWEKTKFEPDESSGTGPELIEDPITIKKTEIKTAISRASRPKKAKVPEICEVKKI